VRRWRKVYLDVLTKVAEGEDREHDHDLTALMELVEDLWQVQGDADAAQRQAELLLERATKRDVRLFRNRARRALKAIRTGRPLYQSREEQKESSKEMVLSKDERDVKRLRSLYSAGESKAADAIVDRILTNHPKTDLAMEAVLIRAGQRRRSKDYDTADQDYQLVVDHGDPRWVPRAILPWASNLRQRGKLDQAEDLLKSLIAKWPRKLSAAWAAKDLESTAFRNTHKASRWRARYRSILEAIVDNPEPGTDDDLEALWLLFEQVWNQPYRRNRDAAERYAQDLHKRSHRAGVHGKHRRRAAKASEALARGVTTYDL